MPHEQRHGEEAECDHRGLARLLIDVVHPCGEGAKINAPLPACSAVCVVSPPPLTVACSFGTMWITRSTGSRIGPAMTESTVWKYMGGGSRRADAHSA